MTLAVLYAFGAMTCYAVLGVLHKVADRIDCRPTQINCLLFGWSALIAGLTLIVNRQAVHAPAGVWSIAIPCGACAATAILLFQIGVRYGKIATSWLLVNLSAAIPILISIIVYGERLSVRKATAIIAMLAAIILLWQDRRKHQEEHA